MTDEAAGNAPGDHPRPGDEISRALEQAGRVERLATLTWRCNMTSATITAYPFWYLMIIAVGVVALWGLCSYGSRKNLAA